MKGVATATMVVLATLVFNVEPGQSAVTCQQVVSYVTPCISYIVRGTGSPPSECCSGVSGLAQLTRFTEDRRAACQCLKDVATRYQGIRDDTAAGLPAACRVQISVPISRSIDCSSIQ